MTQRINFDLVMFLVAEEVRRARWGMLRLERVSNDQSGFIVSVDMPRSREAVVATKVLVRENIPSDWYITIPLRMLCGGLTAISSVEDKVVIAVANIYLQQRLLAGSRALQVRVINMEDTRKNFELAWCDARVTLDEQVVTLEVEQVELKYRSPLVSTVQLDRILDAGVLNEIWHYRFDRGISNEAEVRVWAYMYWAGDTRGFDSRMVSSGMPGYTPKVCYHVLRKICALGLAVGAETRIEDAGSVILDWCARPRMKGLMLRCGEQSLTDEADIKWCAAFLRQPDRWQKIDALILGYTCSICKRPGNESSSWRTLAG